MTDTPKSNPIRTVKVSVGPLAQLCKYVTRDGDGTASIWSSLPFLDENRGWTSEDPDIGVGRINQNLLPFELNPCEIVAIQLEGMILSPEDMRGRQPGEDVIYTLDFTTCALTQVPDDSPKYAEQRHKANPDVLRIRIEHLEKDRDKALVKVEEVKKQLESMGVLYIQAREKLATHRCKICDAKWIKFVDGSWSLASKKAGLCCDTTEMGNQLETIGLTAQVEKVGKERDEARNLLHQLFYTRIHGGYKVEEVLSEYGHDNLWRNINLLIQKP